MKTFLVIDSDSFSDNSSSNSGGGSCGRSRSSGGFRATLSVCQAASLATDPSLVLAPETAQAEALVTTPAIA